MPTLKKLKEDKINIASKLLKKDKEFSPISPEFIKDLRDKTLLERPELQLSIKDYKFMCDNQNNKVLHMMSIALNKPKAKLKKFCKYISVFEENIAKSPKSIAYKINGPICNLPENIRSTILDKFAEILPTKYVLLDWIDENKLNWNMLSLNPNAIDLLEEHYDNIDWENLSQNPNAIKILKKRIKYEQTLYDSGELYTLNEDKIDWVSLSKNPNAIKLLKDRIKYENLLEDDDLDDNMVDWESLSENQNAIDLLKANPNEIDWQLLSKNPNAIDLLKANPNEIDWESLSQNTNAIELLKSNKNEIRWNLLSTNPNAIDLLKQRIEYENNLTKTQYNNLTYLDKIDWLELSANPNAIELLTNNQDKINWTTLCRNPNAIDLLENNPDNIDWVFLASNPNAIHLLKNNNIDNSYQYWNELSKNPAIFKAV